MAMHPPKQTGAAAGVVGGYVADWDPSLVRYIFLDGDNGDDQNVGYIDALPGTVFTPAQTAPVAVRTTHRINEIRPRFGAGRMVVVLLKPRAGFVPYDLAADGDQLGSEDRSGISGYSLMITRASDLTNAPFVPWDTTPPGDLAQLGMASRSLPGPNPDGSFTVASVTPGPNFIQLGLTGGTLPAGYVLAKYRLRVKFASTGQYNYAPVAWGDYADSPDPTIVNLWNVISPGPAEGDKVWLEEPAVILYKFSEADDVVTPDGLPYVGNNLAPNLELAGIALGAGLLPGAACNLGVSVDGPTATYTHCWSELSGGYGVTTTSGCGNLVFTRSFHDETGNQQLATGSGFSGPAVGQTYTAGDEILIDSSCFADSDGAALYTTTFQAKQVQVQYSTLQGAFFACEKVIVSESANNLGPIAFGVDQHAELGNALFVPYWGIGPDAQVTVFPQDGTSAPTFSFQQNTAAWGSPPDSPGYELLPGIYTVVFGIGESQPGSGVLLDLDAGDPTKQLLVTWNSLIITGFEIEGGQKIVCYDLSEAQGYPDNLFPCPRGKIMRMTGSEAPVALLAGTLVGSGGLNTPYFQVLNPATQQPSDLYGVLLTNCQQIFDPSTTVGGYAVVGNDQIMVVAVPDAVATATPYGRPLYASIGTPGSATFDIADSSSKWILGTNAPIGPNDGDLTSVLWRPGTSPQSQLVITTADASSVTSVTYADIPQLSLLLEAGLTYRIKAQLLIVFTPYKVGGSKIQLVTKDGLVLSFSSLSMSFFGAVPAPLLETVSSDVVVGETLGQSTCTQGYWQIDGIVTVSTAGSLVAQFAQVATNTDPTLVKVGSYMLATVEA